MMNFVKSVMCRERGQPVRVSWSRMMVVSSFRFRLLLLDFTMMMVVGGLLQSVDSFGSKVLSKTPLIKSQAPSCRALDLYMLDRNVTIRHVAWEQEGREQLLQVFRGAAVAPVATIKDQTKESLKSLFEDIESGIDGATAIQQSGLQLSHSSRSRLDLWKTLSDTAKEQLQSKIAVEARASQTIDPAEALHILYIDEHICVVNKPSGILAVPGPRRNPSIATLVYDIVQPTNTLENMDQMVVHRLDMDTSGILVFALTVPALKSLHCDFRDRRVQKCYQAVLAGHFTGAETTEIDVALERDPHHPPFMRIAQPKDVSKLQIDAMDEKHIQKFLNGAPKPSWTEMHVQSFDYIHNLPVTRVQLVPHTGRTHQLRVHTAALSFPIVGDDIYGYAGEGDCGIIHQKGNDKEDENREMIQRQLYELQLPLCLHAHRLSLFHPISRAPMVFECESYF